MNVAEYPLLNIPNLTLVILKASLAPGAALDDALARLRKLLQEADETPPLEDDELRAHLFQIAVLLARAGMLELTGDGRMRATFQGRQMLAQHPAGFDFADLVSPVEMRRSLDEQGGGAAASDPRRRQFEEGYDAFCRGERLADNPYLQDSVDHRAWEDGWSDARDDAMREFAA